MGVAQLASAPALREQGSPVQIGSPRPNINMAIKKTKQNIKLIKRESFTTDGIKLYLRSILRVPRLSPAEEIELGKKSLRVMKQLEKN